jgi:2-polyprenyl-3-methyl-5-hydroxy-6-metoxy-1,4-benzoquinol methylase
MPESLKTRHRQNEWMDSPDADPEELARSLVFIRRINSWLGYSRATIHHLNRLASGWDSRVELKILDVATGSGDIPRAILRWADRRKLKCRITAIDLHQSTLTAAIAEGRDDRLQFTRADATALPFADGSFDFVLTGMFLHHLDESAAIKVLQEMDRVANHAVIAADLIRSRRAYFWISLFTLLANPMVKHDARVSVAGAFSRDELISLCGKAGLDYLKPHRHFGHRLVLAGLCAASGKSGSPTIPS